MDPPREPCYHRNNYISTTGFTLQSGGVANAMPEVSQKEVGRRLFHVHREKRVELAIKKIKAGIGSGWKKYSPDQVRILGHILQCTWNVIDQKAWESIPFDRVKEDDVDRMIRLGEGVAPGKNPTTENVEEIKKILLAVS